MERRSVWGKGACARAAELHGGERTERNGAAVDGEEEDDRRPTTTLRRWRQQGETTGERREGGNAGSAGAGTRRTRRARCFIGRRRGRCGRATDPPCALLYREEARAVRAGDGPALRIAL